MPRLPNAPLPRADLDQAADSPTRHRRSLTRSGRCLSGATSRKPKSFSQPDYGANDAGRVPASAPRHRVEPSGRPRRRAVFQRCRCPSMAVARLRKSSSSPAHGCFLQCAGCRPRSDACPQACSAKHSRWSIEQRAGGGSLHLVGFPRQNPGGCRPPADRVEQLLAQPVLHLELVGHQQRDWRPFGGFSELVGPRAGLRGPRAGPAQTARTAATRCRRPRGWPASPRASREVRP